MKSTKSKAKRAKAKTSQNSGSIVMSLTAKSSAMTWAGAGVTVAASATRKSRSSRPLTQSGYMFIVQVGDEREWKPVRLDGDHTLSVTRTPEQVFPRISQEMKDLWKRVVIDDAINWDCYNAHHQTLRLMKVEMTSQDCTAELFQDREEALHNQRWAGLAKLSEREARILGLEEQYALMKLFRNPDAEQEDNRLLDDLRATTAQFGFDGKVDG